MQAPLVFIHIPKTAGSTFLSILRRNFPATDVLLPNGLTAKEAEAFERELALLPTRRAESIHGHVPLTRLSDVPRARFATLLREPVRRQYSHVQMVYGKRNAGPPVTETLTRGRMIDNLQTRMLCNLDEPLTRPADDTLLAAAIAELDRFDFVGVVERFPESMLLAQERLGLRHVSYFRRNVRGRSHAPDDVEALRAHNRLDLELYAHALTRIEPDLERLGPRAAALRRADEAMSSRRPVADVAALGYVADYAWSALAARARRGVSGRSPRSA